MVFPVFLNMNSSASDHFDQIRCSNVPPRLSVFRAVDRIQSNSCPFPCTGNDDCIAVNYVIHFYCREAM